MSTKRAKYAMIDITIYTNPPTKMWYISQLAHKKGGGGDANPSEWGDTEEFETEEDAEAAAKGVAQWIVKTGEARKATVFSDGSSIYTVFAKRNVPKQR